MSSDRGTFEDQEGSFGWKGPIRTGKKMMGGGGLPKKCTEEPQKNSIEEGRRDIKYLIRTIERKELKKPHRP